MRNACWMLSVVALLAAGAVALAQQRDADASEEAMKLAREGAKGYMEAFSRGDAQAMAELYTKEGVRIFAGERRVQGHEELERYYGRFFTENEGARIHITVEQARLLRPDVLVAEGPWTLEGAAARFPDRGNSAVVLTEDEGQWRLAYALVYPAAGGEPR
jgi:uncharacterized protein (TIGR02246 family)